MPNNRGALTQLPQRFRLSPLRVATATALAGALILSPISFHPTTASIDIVNAYADSESSCFVAGTEILMADGSIRAIESLRSGDRVMGYNGAVNRVTGVEVVPLAGRMLHSFNGELPFVTAEHPFMSVSGWASLDPGETFKENPRLDVEVITVGSALKRWQGDFRSQSSEVGGQAIATTWVATTVPVPIDSIEASSGATEAVVYNLLLDGDHTYIANGWVVHNKGDSEREDGDKEDGDKEDGDKEDGDKEDGDKEDGDKEDGDKEDGDKEDGDKEDGDKEDGENEGGDKEDGDKGDGDKGDGDKEDGDRDDSDRDDGDSRKSGDPEESAKAKSETVRDHFEREGAREVSAEEEAEAIANGWKK